MRIDNTMQQQISSMGMQAQKEVAGEKENDGDSDDSARSVSRAAPTSQLFAQGVGNKVNVLA